jgi:hypothetical protein
MKMKVILVALCLATILTTMPAWAQTKEDGKAEPPQKSEALSDKDEETELAKAAQNPVANMLSFPLQSNINFRYGPSKDKNITVTNFQPVIPISLGKDWNLITRTIVPIIYTEYPAYQTGIGNVQFTGFLSPANSGKFIWGVGPVFQFPTRTDTYLGNQMWSAGPSAVGLFMTKSWVVGLLAQNVWSFAGPGGKDNPSVNAFLAQPFINYNMPHGWYLTFSPIITADWKADGHNQWTVPLGAGVGKIFKIGKLPFNANIAAYYNVVRPDIGPDWQIRAQLVLLLPKGLF